MPVHSCVYAVHAFVPSSLALEGQRFEDADLQPRDKHNSRLALALATNNPDGLFRRWDDFVAAPICATERVGPGDDKIRLCWCLNAPSIISTGTTFSHKHTIAAYSSLSTELRYTCKIIITLYLQPTGPWPEDGEWHRDDIKNVTLCLAREHRHCRGVNSRRNKAGFPARVDVVDLLDVRRKLKHRATRETRRTIIHRKAVSLISQPAKILTTKFWSSQHTERVQYLWHALSRRIELSPSCSW